MRRILVVEDEVDIARAVADRLRSAGFEVDAVHDGLVAVARAAELEPDLVVLDLLLPGLDGLEVCRRIQASRPTPVLMLTARDDETEMLIGLGVGADDYVTKPFSPRELVARVQAILRRVDRSVESVASGEDVVEIGPVELRVGTRRARRDGADVHLTPTEFDLVAHLAGHRGEVRTREQLLHAVWGYRDASGARTVDSHVRSVRRKLGDDVIRTVHGVGYAAGGAW